jgi:hypothetical protein
MAPSYTTQTAITLSIFAFSAIFWSFRKCRWTAVPYEAPLEQKNSQEGEALGRYAVRLKPGHSLEQRSATTGYDIKTHVDGFLG